MSPPKKWADFFQKHKKNLLKALFGLFDGFLATFFLASKKKHRFLPRTKRNLWQLQEPPWFAELNMVIVAFFLLEVPWKFWCQEKVTQR